MNLPVGRHVAFGLNHAQTGISVTQGTRKIAISDVTFYNWKKKYSGVGITEIRRLRQLEDEISNFNADCYRSHLGQANAVMQLKHHVVKIEYLPPELLPQNVDKKTTVVEVRCTDDVGRHFIVEMQVARQKSLKKRILFNAARVYGRQIAPAIIMICCSLFLRYALLTMS